MFKIGLSTFRIIRQGRFVYGFLSAFLFIMNGCAGTTTFTAYPTKIAPFKNNLTQGIPIDFNKCLTSEVQSKDLIVYNMERGRLKMISGQTDESIKDFKAAIEKIKEDEQKAIVSASGVGANVAAIALNDNAIPYKADGYEHVVLHHYQALNYLNKKDIEAAVVEVRLANAKQEEELAKHEKELETLKKETEEKGADNSAGLNTISSAYAQMDEVAGKVKNSFQNAYSFYLSGFIYEANKQDNDAYIDYKKALEIYPENKYLQNDVIRLAATLDMREDLDSLKSRFKNTPNNNSGNKLDRDVLIIFEDEMVPVKQEVKIPLPIPKIGLVSIAFPIYNEKLTNQSNLGLSIGQQQIGQTEQICDFRSLAVKALKEKAAAMAVRQLARAAVKGATAATSNKIASDKFGLMGQLGSMAINSAWNYASENADLRSWSTLPSNVQIMRAKLPTGTHNLTLKHESLLADSHFDLTIPESGKTIVHVVNIGNQLFTKVINL